MEYKVKIIEVACLMAFLAEEMEGDDFVRALHGVHVDVGIELCRLMSKYREKERKLKGEKGYENYSTLNSVA